MPPFRKPSPGKPTVIERPVFSRDRVPIARTFVYNAAAMLLSRATFRLVVLLFSCLALGGQARADNTEEARAYVNKATAAYALNHYAVAAENFEKAFELKADPALLYNAAQSYRLAGNKERALELYESYVRVYTGRKDARPDIEGHIKQLKEAIERDKAAATSPPITTMPMGGAPSEGREPPPTSPPPVTPVTPIAPAGATSPPGALAPPPSSAGTTSSPVVLTQSADQSTGSDSVTKKTWFWVAVGGGVAAAVIVGLLIGLSGTDPASASIGKVNGN
jgi:tetratricopeptide (TPR) repeat protein